MKKSFLWLGVLLLGISIIIIPLAGCKGEEAAEEVIAEEDVPDEMVEEEEAAEEAVVEEEEEVPEITLTGEITVSVVRGIATDVVTPLAEEFMELHPETKVNVVLEPEGAAFDPLFAAGTAPDVIMGSLGSQAAAFAAQDVLVPLEDLPGAEELFAEIESSTIIEFFGHKYYVPTGADITMMIYNKELFTEAGLDPETPPKTYAEFLNAAEKISALPDREGGDKTYGTVFWNEALQWGGWYWNMLQPIYLGANQNTYGILNSIGSDVVFDHPDAKLKEFFEFCREAQQFAPPDMTNNFFTHSIGMWMQYGYSWSSNLAPAEPPMVIGDNVGIAPVPVPGEGDQSYTTLGGRIFVITKSTPERESLGWEFIKFMMADEVNLKYDKEMGLLPVKLALKDDAYFDTPENKPFVEMIPYAVIPQSFGKSDAVHNSLLGIYSQVVVDGTLTPEEGVTAAVEAARAAITQ